MVTEQNIFSRAELLLGHEAMARIAQERVIVFGVGGVGSWCVELLENKGQTAETCPTKAQVNGSLVHITAVFGFMLAGLVVQDAI